MDSSYLKDLLWRGREVQFYYGAKKYIVKLVNYRSTTEYAFGPEFGNKITSDYFDDIWYRRDYGANLGEMLREAQYVSVC